MKLTNEHGISLPLAVWLLHDDYDFITSPTTFGHVSAEEHQAAGPEPEGAQRTRSGYVSFFIASRFGNAIHDSVEKAWKRIGSRADEEAGLSRKGIQKNRG